MALLPPGYEKVPRGPLSHWVKAYRAKTSKPIIGVLRTKGGSGEGHAVCVLLDKLSRRGKKALVVNEHSSYHVSMWCAGPDNSGDHDFRTQRWQAFLTENPDEFAISSFETTVFCRGTSSAVDPNTFKEVAEISELVVLSVNLDVQDSIYPAYGLAERSLSHPEWVHKVFFLCWLSRAASDFPYDAPYQYVVLNAQEYLDAYRAGGLGELASASAAEDCLDRELTRIFPG